MKCIWVSWIDSVHLDDWNYAADIVPAKPEVSCGILVKDEPDFITIALSYAQETDQYGHLIAIPRVAIKDMQIFNKPTRKRNVRPSEPAAT